MSNYPTSKIADTTLLSQKKAKQINLTPQDFVLSCPKGYFCRV